MSGAGGRKGEGETAIASKNSGGIGARQGAPDVSTAVKINFAKIPMPVFDTFQQVFIVTDGNESFYMDLDGEYDRNLPCTIQWSNIPTSVEIVRPFLVGLL